MTQLQQSPHFQAAISARVPTSLDEIERLLACLEPPRGSAGTTIPTKSLSISQKTSLASLSQAASIAEIQVEMTGLLQHYYLRELPSKLQESVLRDFCVSLRGFPRWAIVKARTEWLSDANHKHRQKPVPGDIQALARRVMQPVEAAKQRLSGQEAKTRVGTRSQRQGADEAGLHALIDEARAHSRETMAICLGRARLVSGRLDCGPSRMGEQGFARWYLGNHAAELLAMARDLGVTLRREVVA